MRTDRPRTVNETSNLRTLPRVLVNDTVGTECQPIKDEIDAIAAAVRSRKFVGSRLSHRTSVIRREGNQESAFTRSPDQVLSQLGGVPEPQIFSS